MRSTVFVVRPSASISVIGITIQRGSTMTRNIDRRFLAHPKETAEPELFSHCLKVARKAQDLASQTNLSLDNIPFYAGLLHDIGKLNPYYQKLFAMDENERKWKQQALQKEYFRGHSLLSALAARQLLTNNVDIKGKTLIISAITGHHSAMRQLDKTLSNYIKNDDIPATLKRSMTEMIGNLENFAKEVKEQNLPITLDWDRCLRKFRSLPRSYNPYSATSSPPVLEYVEFCSVFSALLQADRGSFFEWEPPLFDISLDTGVLIREGPLSALRSEFQNWVLTNNAFAERMMVLEAPTGVGKTKIFLDILRKLEGKERFERVFYFSPLLALTDDFENKMFGKTEEVPEPRKKIVVDEEPEDILIYNHTFSGTLGEKRMHEDANNDEEGEYEHEEEGQPDFFKTREYFEMESFNKKLVITTTQRLLMTLYSNSCRDKMKLMSFKNSLLIIDEVQTIPKFLLPNLIDQLKVFSERMNARVLLVSATIPHYIRNAIPAISYPTDVKEGYLSRTAKNITYLPALNLDEEVPQWTDGRTLLMLNTRRKALDQFDTISSKKTKVIYLSSGIRKKDRKDLINGIGSKTSELPLVVVSTQVMEAGVDISFTRMYREVAPLDNIVQAMGRLNREAEAASPPTLFVFSTDDRWEPYSELEFSESLSRIKVLDSSKALYEELPKYYEAIDHKHQKNRDLANELNYYIEKLDFDGVWAFVKNKVLSEDSRGSVFIPDSSEWDRVRQLFSRSDGKPRRQIFRHYADLTAELPKNVRELKIEDMFEQDLMENGVLLPKKEYLSEIYDEKTGLDRWLRK